MEPLIPEPVGPNPLVILNEELQKNPSKEAIPRLMANCLAQTEKMGLSSIENASPLLDKIVVRLARLGTEHDRIDQFTQSFWTVLGPSKVGNAEAASLQRPVPIHMVLDIDTPDPNGIMMGCILDGVKAGHAVLTTRSLYTSSGVSEKERERNCLFWREQIQKHLQAGYEIFEYQGFLLFLPRKGDETFEERLAKLNIAPGLFKQITLEKAEVFTEKRPSFDDFSSFLGRTTKAPTLWILSGHGLSNSPIIKEDGSFGTSTMIAGLSESHYHALLDWGLKTEAKGLLLFSCYSGGEPSLIHHVSKRKSGKESPRGEAAKGLPFPVVIRGITDTVSLGAQSAQQNLGTLLERWIDSFAEPGTQTAHHLRSLVQETEKGLNPKEYVNSMQVYFPHSEESPLGFMVVAENPDDYAITFPKLRAAQYSKEPITAGNARTLQVKPVVIDTILKIGERGNPLLCSLIPGAAVHVCGKLILPGCTLKEFIKKNFDNMFQQLLGVTKVFLFHEIEAADETVKHVFINLKGGLFGYQKEGKYYLQNRSSDVPEEVSERIFIIERNKAIERGKPDKVALRIALGGQQGLEEFYEYADQALGEKEKKMSLAIREIVTKPPKLKPKALVEKVRELSLDPREMIAIADSFAEFGEDYLTELLETGLFDPKSNQELLLKQLRLVSDSPLFRSRLIIDRLDPSFISSLFDAAIDTNNSILVLFQIGELASKGMFVQMPQILEGIAEKVNAKCLGGVKRTLSHVTTQFSGFAISFFAYETDTKEFVWLTLGDKLSRTVIPWSQFLRNSLIEQKKLLEMTLKQPEALKVIAKELGTEIPSNIVDQLVEAQCQLLIDVTPDKREEVLKLAPAIIMKKPFNLPDAISTEDIVLALSIAAESNNPEAFEILMTKLNQGMEAQWDKQTVDKSRAEFLSRHLFSRMIIQNKGVQFKSLFERWIPKESLEFIPWGDLILWCKKAQADSCFSYLLDNFPDRIPEEVLKKVLVEELNSNAGSLKTLRKLYEVAGNKLTAADLADFAPSWQFCWERAPDLYAAVIKKTSLDQQSKIVSKAIRGLEFDRTILLDIFRTNADLKFTEDTIQLFAAAFIRRDVELLGDLIKRSSPPDPVKLAEALAEIRLAPAELLPLAERLTEADPRYIEALLDAQILKPGETDREGKLPVVDYMLANPHGALALSETLIKHIYAKDFGRVLSACLRMNNFEKFYHVFNLTQLFIENPALLASADKMLENTIAEVNSRSTSGIHSRVKAAAFVPTSSTSEVNFYAIDVTFDKPEFIHIVQLQGRKPLREEVPWENYARAILLGFNDALNISEMLPDFLLQPFLERIDVEIAEWIRDAKLFISNEHHPFLDLGALLVANKSLGEEGRQLIEKISAGDRQLARQIALKCRHTEASQLLRR